jgi:hypothetical protein
MRTIPSSPRSTVPPVSTSMGRRSVPRVRHRRPFRWPCQSAHASRSTPSGLGCLRTQPCIGRRRFGPPIALHHGYALRPKSSRKVRNLRRTASTSTPRVQLRDRVAVRGQRSARRGRSGGFSHAGQRRPAPGTGGPEAGRWRARVLPSNTRQRSGPAPPVRAGPRAEPAPSHATAHRQTHDDLAARRWSFRSPGSTGGSSAGSPHSCWGAGSPGHGRRRARQPAGEHPSAEVVVTSLPDADLGSGAEP